MNNINFSTSTKKILIKVFTLLIVAVNVGLFYGIYSRINGKESIEESSATYNVFLSEYLYQYKKNQEMFLNYTFFINYYNQIFENRTSMKEQYTQSVNDFSNMNQEQYFILNGLVNRLMSQKGYSDVLKISFNHNDWSRKDVVIRDEKGFNVSYIFSVLTALQYQINNNNKTQQWITLSAQEIIDCCDMCLKLQTPEAVYDYIKANGVIEQKLYPYENSRFDRVPKACRKQNKTGKRYYIQKYKSIKNCSRLFNQLAKAPIVVGVDGRQFSSYQYSIYKQCQRKTTHYSTLVGVSPQYWKIQNSWGRKWGQRGFMRIGPGDTCGICIAASAPRLKQE